MRFRRLFPAASVRLFGDRQRYGKVPPPGDADWSAWLAQYPEHYQASQGGGAGRLLSHAGYRVMGRVPLAGRRILEVGPGALPHREYWREAPAHYTVADIRVDFLEQSASALRLRGVPHDQVLLEDGVSPRLPFADGDFDLIVSFFSLEHLPDLAGSLAEMNRVLRPGGMLVGAIPAEGGLAWGMGRLLTTRRRLRRLHPEIDPEKYICWEHPNFSDEVLAQLDARFRRGSLSLWPLGRWAGHDCNLVARFLYEKC